MPHLVILSTPNLERETDMTALCRSLADTMLGVQDDQGQPDALHKKVGDALLMATETHFQPVFRQRHIGITLQIDVGPEVFDAKLSNLHPLFQKVTP